MALKATAHQYQTWILPAGAERSIEDRSSSLMTDSMFEKFKF
jgi:hypothetical protein